MLSREKRRKIKMRRPLPAIEWITLCLLVATYGVWALGTTLAVQLSPLLGILLLLLLHQPCSKGAMLWLLQQQHRRM